MLLATFTSFGYPTALHNLLPCLANQSHHQVKQCHRVCGPGMGCVSRTYPLISILVLKTTTIVLTDVLEPKYEPERLCWTRRITGRLFLITVSMNTPPDPSGISPPQAINHHQTTVLDGPQNAGKGIPLSSWPLPLTRREIKYSINGTGGWQRQWLVRSVWVRWANYDNPSMGWEWNLWG